MLGIRFAHFDSMLHIIVYKNGRIKRQGRGLSFYYFAPTTSIVAVPIASDGLPFIFSETTRDHQSISVQGQVTYRIGNPIQTADMLNFTVDQHGRWKSNDMEKLSQTIINESQTAAAAFVHELSLKEAIRAAKSIEERILEGLKKSTALEMLGIEILSVNILAVKASPEMARALETETREKLQQDADQAIFERRNFAVEQERIIKESELNTQIAVEEKKKQIAEKQTESKIQQEESDRKLREMKVEADISVESQQAEKDRMLREMKLKTDNTIATEKAENERKLREMKVEADVSVEARKQELIETQASNDRKQREMKIEADIVIETQRQNLIEKQSENDRIAAETKGYVIEMTLKPYREFDWKTLQALLGGDDPKTNMSLAFRMLAENADKIGNLNISPDLLESLLNN